MNAISGRTPSYSRTVFIKLENHKLIESGVADSTTLHSVSTCSAYEMYFEEIQQPIHNWTKKTQQIKESGEEGGEQLTGNTQDQENPPLLY